MALSENHRYIVQVFVGALSAQYEALSVEASKQTSSEEIVCCIADKLNLNDGAGGPYELAEVVGDVVSGECKERRLGSNESPVAVMMLWPNNNTGQYYRFYLREKIPDEPWMENFSVDPQLIKDYFQRFLYQPKDREYPDLCQLPELNEQTLLDNLRARFGAGYIYTYVGSILIALNPFKFYPIYNPKYVKLYQNKRIGSSLPPHIFAVADAAYHCMLRERTNQCIVISGESGSGKTESTNFLLHHLTALSQKGSHGSGVEQTILSAGPVLEAFGNAKTAHNNNSSRFGKFIQVNYKENGMVHGAVVQKYLLEKSRICSQGRNERNYHVFYYLLAGASEQEREQLHLLSVDKYNYLSRTGCSVVPGVDEQYEFSRLKQSMDMVGFTMDKQRRLFAVLSAVLLLGNVEFQPQRKSYHHDEAVGVRNPEVVSLISSLLRVKQETLLAALTSKRARASGETLVINYRLPEAIATRDAMAKCLYGALFDWIVMQVNHALLSKKDTLREHQGHSIGVLDIFGFEDFGPNNSFEQLCINYANEHLQYYFNQHVFKYEQEEYRREGIRWTDIGFSDNTGCLQLIEGKPGGLLCLLDDQCNFPWATNETLLQKFNSVHEENPFYEKPTRREPAFVVRHYAGRVKYQATAMREKNLDLMRQDIVSVLKNSSLAFVRELVGVDPVAVFRWAIVRAFFRGYFAFMEAGSRHRVNRVDGASRVPRASIHAANESIVREHRQENDRSPSKPTANSCVFCTQVRKKQRGELVPCSFAKEDNNYESFLVVIDKATQVLELSILERIDTYQEQNLPIPYHRSCKTEFLNKCRQKKENTDWHQRREKHERAREQVYVFIEENVVKKMHIFQFTFITNLFRQFLLEEYNSDQLPQCFDTGNLQSQIENKFKDKVQIIYNQNRKHIVSSSATLENVNMRWVNDINTINTSALILRRIILKIEKKTVGRNVRVSHLIKGECEVPDILIEFFGILLTGGNVDKIKNPRILLLANSFAQDIIYSVQRGHIKTSKHVTLGLALKSLTSSEKIVRLVHAYGHCISYTKVLELETEATYTIANTNRFCPAEMTLQPHLNSGFAFDNFDRYVETCDGKDTLHDTVGISFQDHISITDEMDFSADDDCDIHNDLEMASKRMRRTFECDSLNIAPFTSKPVFGNTLPISSDVHVPNNLKEVKRLDRIWMMSHAFNIPTPMWVGFNVKIITDKTGTQDIFYLTPINQSPTQNSVVYETMMRSVRGADECGQKYAEVHYDLAIASKALKIQSNVLRLETESPLSRLFIHLGSFHIAISYFKAIGKYIENCGITDILIDSGLLASGSIRSFLEGKHFNRCKRLHPLIALTIEIMHFKCYLETENVTVDDECISFLQHFQSRKDAEIPNNLISYRLVDNEKLLNLLEEYEIFRQKTINGDHGQTPKFYLIYVEIINNYLIFDRSIRTGDVELFKYSLPTLLNLFFTFNHQNYARNLTLYCSNLQNVEKTHPGLTVNIGIKRTKKPFSKREVDCTVETTINADAAKRMTGVTWLKNSISARQRWSKSHSIRTQVISHVFAESLLKPRDEITNDLREHKIKKNCEQIKKLQKSINDRLNPFSPTLKNELLYNICNGESASNEVQSFLLNVVEIGEEQRKRFLQECALDPKRFEEPITKNKVCTFKTKKVIKRKDGKIEEVKIQRELFGRLLGISLERKVEIEKVLEYPLTPVPLSLCHLDGSINKTDKAKLIDPILKRERIEKAVPNELDAIVIDGFFYLYTLRDIPTTFGAISHNLLRNITNHGAKEIHLVFDTYPEPSIKDYEHKIRENIRQTDFVIEGPQMKRPRNFFAELKNIKFKQAFVKFLINDWMTQDRVSLMKRTQKVFVNYEICYSYRRVADSIVREVSDTFTCGAHEEADTKVVYHVCNMPKNSNILIKCSDTDIFIIMLANMKHLLVDVAEDQYAIDRKIWMQLGTGNNVRNVDMCAVFCDLGEKLCTSLAAFHAFTGCDFNPSFYRKAKTRPLQLLLKSPKFQEAFITMGEYRIVTDPDVMNTTFDVIQNFVCLMYNVRAVSTVNEARCLIFDRIYIPKNENEEFKKKMSKLEATAFPPSCRELQQQMRRATYITQIWCNANVHNPSTLTPNNYGWELINMKYEFHWFDGEEYPVKIIDIVEAGAETDNDANESTDAERDSEGELTSDAELTEYETDNESDEDSI